MIDSLLHLVFLCRHKHLSRPVTSGSSTYIVCLDCGKHFDYDPIHMRLGNARPAQIAPPPRTEVARVDTKWSFRRMAWASLPFVVLIGSMFRRKRNKPTV